MIGKRVHLKDNKRPLKVKKSPKNIILETSRQYASSTTAHGFSYLTEERSSIGERIFWIIVVILAITFSTSQMTTLYNEWQDNPVITTLDTVALPIEEIEFPAVTICPQGSVNRILDSVLFKQFKEYIRNKTVEKYARIKRSTLFVNTKHQKKDDGEVLWHLDYAQMMAETKKFLKDVYPGAKDKPTRLINLLTSNDPKKMIDNEAILKPNGAEACNQSTNYEILDTLNKHLNNDPCPDGFVMYEHLGCIHSNQQSMTYGDAMDYCGEIAGSQLLYFESYEEIKTLEKFKIIGKFTIELRNFILTNYTHLI